MRHYPYKALALPLLTALLCGSSMAGTPALAANTGEAKQETPAGQRTPVGEIIDDAWITTKVKAMLLKEDALSALKIDVDTKDGVVRLSGQVDNSGQAAQAVDIARKVTGGKDVRADLLPKQ